MGFIEMIEQIIGKIDATGNYVWTWKT